MKRIWAALAALMIIAPFGASAKNPSRGNCDIEITGTIREIVNHTAYDVKMSYGKSQLNVTGPKDLVDELNVTLSPQGTLSITYRYPGRTHRGNPEVRIFGTSDELGSVKVMGSGSVILDRLDCTRCTLLSMGSGNIKGGSIDSTGATVSLYGSGNIEVGTLDCTSLEVLSQGSGNISIRDVDSTSTKIILQGSGNIVMNKIDATYINTLSQGSGDIRISGKATATEMTLQGSGDIVATGMDASRVSKVVQGSGRIRD